MGVVDAIYVAATAGTEMASMERCHALPGRGLTGDRYAKRRGAYSKWPSDHELTLIEGEVLGALAEAGLTVLAGGTRRNLVTRNVRLNDLVGQEFFIGAVRCRGTRLCDPCGYLERLLGIKGFAKALEGRGGLRAVIVDGGEICVGSEIRLAKTRSDARAQS
jgi:hypothetical protein